MPITVTCPGCSARMRAPDTAAGKTIKCPKCQGTIAVPQARASADSEVAGEEPPPPKRPAFGSGAVQSSLETVVTAEVVDKVPPKPKAKAVVVEEDVDEDPTNEPATGDEEDPQPKKKAKVIIEYDGEDPPPKKRSAPEDDEDEYEDEKPRNRSFSRARRRPAPRRRRSQSFLGNKWLARNFAVIVLVLALMRLTGAILTLMGVGKDEPSQSTRTVQPNRPPTSPPGELPVPANRPGIPTAPAGPMPPGSNPGIR